MTDQPTVTITAPMLETALRTWLATADYDLHKELECDEDGDDVYPDEAAEIFEHLQRLAADDPEAHR